MRGFPYNALAGGFGAREHFESALPGSAFVAFLRSCLPLIIFGAFGCGLVLAQDAAQSAAKPADRVIGEITAVDAAGKKITVKDDTTKAEYIVSLSDTKTFLRVAPG